MRGGGFGLAKPESNPKVRDRGPVNAMRGQPRRAVRRNVPVRLAEDKEAIFSALPKASGK